MKKLLGFVLFTLALVACGTDSRHFKIDGRLLHMNQGEFYVYSPDGLIDGVDTIKVQGGRFSLEVPCVGKGILVIVFPNFSEQPIFAEAGSEVDVDGDASHLKEIKIKGNDDNKLMTTFRQHVLHFSPPETVAFAKQFVTDHPESPVSVYLVSRHFLRGPGADYKTASQLLSLMEKAQPDNTVLLRINKQVKSLSAAAVGASLPTFSGKAFNGKNYSSGTLAKAPVAVVYTWSSWSYESTGMVSQLRQLQQQSNGNLQVMGICVDGSKSDCRAVLQRDSVAWPVVCDEMMFDGALVRQLGLLSVPDNIVLRRGRVVARGLQPQELINRLKTML